MRLNLVIGGIIVGIVIFIVANVMVTFAPDVLNTVFKPMLCPSGEYASYGGSMTRNGQAIATRSTYCELANGESYSVDGQQLGLIILLSAAPILVTGLLAWVMGLFRPRKLPDAIGVS
jgi:hypothetical protein